MTRLSGSIARDNPLEVGARSLLYLGLFLSSLLTLRISGFTLGDIALVGSAVLLIFVGPAKSGRTVRGAVWLALGFLLLGGLLSTLRAVSPGGTVLVVVRLIYLIGVLPWQFERLVHDERRFTRSVYCWGAGAAVCGYGTLIQYFLGPDAIPGSEVTDVDRFPGFAQHVSDTGAICAGGAALFFAGLVTGAKARRVCAAGLLGCVVGIVLSGSVSALLSLAIVAMYLFLRGNLRLGRVIIVGLVVIAAFDVAVSVQDATSYALNPIERIQQVIGDSASVAQDSGLNTSASRLQTDELGLQGFFRHPVIGKGLDEPSTIVDSASQLPVHNILLAALFEGGLLLALGLLIPLAGATHRILRVPRHAAAGMQVAAAYLASLTFAMTTPSLFNRYLWIPLAMVVVFCARTWPQSGEPEARDNRQASQP